MTGHGEKEVRGRRRYCLLTKLMTQDRDHQNEKRNKMRMGRAAVNFTMVSQMDPQTSTFGEGGLAITTVAKKGTALRRAWQRGSAGTSLMTAKIVRLPYNSVNSTHRPPFPLALNTASLLLAC